MANKLLDNLPFQVLTRLFRADDALRNYTVICHKGCGRVEPEFIPRDDNFVLCTNCGEELQANAEIVKYLRIYQIPPQDPNWASEEVTLSVKELREFAKRLEGKKDAKKH